MSTIERILPFEDSMGPLKRTSHHINFPQRATSSVSDVIIWSTKWHDEHRKIFDAPPFLPTIDHSQFAGMFSRLLKFNGSNIFHVAAYFRTAVLYRVSIQWQHKMQANSISGRDCFNENCANSSQSTVFRIYSFCNTCQDDTIWNFIYSNKE